MNNLNTAKKGHMPLRVLTAVSVFCALSYICVFLIRFKVSFLTFDLKDAIMVIGSMYFGPVAAVIMPAVVSFIEFLTISDTGVYGLIMNFLSSVSLCLVSSLIYKFRKNLICAIVSLACGVCVMTGVMLLANMYITPYYMHVTAEQVRDLIPTLFMPFNLIKGIVNASVVMILYKPFSRALKSAGVIKKLDVSDQDSGNGSIKVGQRIIVIAVSLVVLIVAILVMILKMNATIDI